MGNWFIAAHWRHMVTKILVKIDSGNNFLSSNTKLLPEHNHQWTLGEAVWQFQWGNFSGDFQCIYPSYDLTKLLSLDYSRIFQDQRITEENCEKHTTRRFTNSCI